MSSGWHDALRPALAFRLAAWYGVLFVVSALALTGLSYLLLSRSLESRDRQFVADTADRYADEYRARGQNGLADAIDIDRREGRHERLFIRVRDRDAAVVFSNLPSGWDEFDVAVLDRSGGSAGAGWTQLTSRRGSTVLDVVSTTLGDGTVVQVGRSSEVRDEVLEHFRSRALVMLAVILLIALAGGATFTHVGLEPVRRLAGTLTVILRTGELDRRVVVGPSSDPLDQLGVQVNAMLDRIQALVGGMRGALDNVAHDLRTPLTRLRSVLEATLENPNADPEGLARALEEVERVSTTLTTLMDISEAETGAMRLVRTRFALRESVQEALDLYQDLAEDRQIALDMSVAASVEVFADRTRLRQVVANLLDNALKYTPAGGQVRVEAEAGGADVVLRVSDTGEGILAEDLPHIWDRLYRAERSRSARGTGLGLALVKAIVEAHGGRVGVESRPGRGSVFSVVLPAPGPADGLEGGPTRVG